MLISAVLTIAEKMTISTSAGQFDPFRAFVRFEQEHSVAIGFPSDRDRFPLSYDGILPHFPMAPSALQAWANAGAASA
jgi:hypothetical protein